ncbi:MAG TPA: hypothetical protein VM142_08400 [Acidimicrobiales bacterium]|nr:hypothetical protein [Acidimicrobiales bacterium]
MPPPGVGQPVAPVDHAVAGELAAPGGTTVGGGQDGPRPPDGVATAGVGARDAQQLPAVVTVAGAGGFVTGEHPSPVLPAVAGGQHALVVPQRAGHGRRPHREAVVGVGELHVVEPGRWLLAGPLQAAGTAGLEAPAVPAVFAGQDHGVVGAGGVLLGLFGVAVAHGPTA